MGGTDAGLYFRHTDHLGSTSVLSDENGDQVAGSDVLFAPFGEVRGGDLSELTDMGYTGQKLDRSADGLMYYNARYYMPELRRFISADTILPDPINPQTLNRFSYVVNNPLIYNDPTGHTFYCPSDMSTWECNFLGGIPNGGASTDDSSSGDVSNGDNGAGESGSIDDGEIFIPPMNDIDPTDHMTCEFGTKDCGGRAPNDRHRGIDISPGYADYIFASFGGKVVGSSKNDINGWNTDYGTFVIIKTSYDDLSSGMRRALNVDEGEAVYSLYAHMVHDNQGNTTVGKDQQLVSVQPTPGVGADINQGDIIGIMGDTGKTSGAHLHFEVWVMKDDKPFADNVLQDLANLTPGKEGNYLVNPQRLFGMLE